MDQYDLLLSFPDANDASKVVLEEKSGDCLQGSDLSASHLGLRVSVQMF